MIREFTIIVIALIACLLSATGQGAVFAIIGMLTLIPPRAKTLPMILLLALAACGFAQIGWFAWLRCAAVIAAFLLLLCASRRMVGYELTVILGLLWLSLPIWLTHPFAATLARFHPLMAINSTTSQGIWTERPLMYQWTALGQDVAYSLPTSVGWCVLAHSIVAGILMIFARFRAPACTSEA